MKLRKVRIVVEDIDSVKRRWGAALRGKGLPSKSGGKMIETISVGSWEVLGRVLSPPRLQLLAAVSTKKPTSIAHLARLLKRDFKNTHSDVKFLAELGMLELREEGPRKTMVPTPIFGEIEFPLGA
jgi:predicted transcriptional regulator